MANELVYRDEAGKTVTVDVDGASGSVGAGIAASESSGLYRATMPSVSAGVYWLRWNNTTDSTTHREWVYWDGSKVGLPMPLTAQQARDSLDSASTSGFPSVDVQLNNIIALTE